MKVCYEDGEVEVFEGVGFDNFDLESRVAPMLGALIFDYGEKGYFIPMDKVKKIEFTYPEDEEDEYE